ncbi:MAG TPA: DsrE family protein [Gammaproteobacteria bacterium]|nr:DsrE family protein [Gammaproteobacteria bacterium]
MSKKTRFTGFQNAMLLATAFGVAFLFSQVAAGQPAEAQPQQASPKSKTASQPKWTHPAIKDIGGVHPRPELPVRPDPAANYKILVDVVSDERDPAGRFYGLQRLARLVNLMAYAKVPAEHVHIVAVLDGPTGAAAFSNAFYRKRFNSDNPNLAALRALKKAGVELMICSQALAEHGLPDSAVIPEVTVTLSALTDMVVYGQRGYTYMQL